MDGLVILGIGMLGLSLVGMVCMLLDAIWGGIITVETHHDERQ